MYTSMPVGFVKPITDPWDERYIYLYMYMNGYFLYLFYELFMYRWIYHRYMDLMGNRIIGFWVKKSPLHVRFSPPICFTLPETNIAPENGWLEEEFPFGARPIFRGELLASGRVIVLARG